MTAKGKSEQDAHIVFVGVRKLRHLFRGGGPYAGEYTMFGAI